MNPFITIPKIPQTKAIKNMNSNSPKNELKPSLNIKSEPKVNVKAKVPIKPDPIAVPVPTRAADKNFYKRKSLGKTTK